MTLSADDIYFTVAEFPDWTYVGWDSDSCVTRYNGVFYFIDYQPRRFVWVYRYRPNPDTDGVWVGMQRDHPYVIHAMPYDWWNLIKQQCTPERVTYTKREDVAGAVKPEYLKWRKHLPTLLMEEALS